MFCCFSWLRRWYRRDRLQEEIDGGRPPTYVVYPGHVYISVGDEQPPPYAATPPETQNDRRANPVKQDSGQRKANNLGLTLLRAVRGKGADLAMVLLGQGANPNAEDTYGPALTQAIRKGDSSLATELLGQGANPNAEDTYGSALPVNYRAVLQ